MNQHHDNDRQLFQAPSATGEQLGFEVAPLTMLMQSYLATKRAHYLSMSRQPRSKQHLKFILKELKGVDRQQQLQRGYTKLISL